MSFFLFPGQGSQVPGMGKDFYEAGGPAKEVFDEAGAIAGDSFLTIIFEGPAETLTDTRNAQVALLTTEVAIARHLESVGIAPSGCAGHSLGEIPALVVAGALAFPDAFRLTQVRARLMSEDIPEGGMAAVMGLAPDAIRDALPAGVDVANYNGPQQTIISGTSEGLEAAQEALKNAGAKRVLPLKVSGPFHSSLMARAAEQFREAIAEVSIAAPTVPFISSVSAQQESDPDRIRDLLYRQLTHPVRWTEVMARISSSDRVLEVGPGRVLQGLAKRMDNAPEIQSTGTLPDVAALQA